MAPSPCREFCAEETSSSTDDLSDSSSERDPSEDFRDGFFEHVEENLTFAVHETETLTQGYAGDKLSHDQQVENAASCNADRRPLYPSAKVRIGSTIVLLVLFTIKYNLAADAIGHLLS